MLNVYANVLRAKVMASFEAMSRGDASVALALMADDVHYRFEGAHALGGERFTKTAVAAWFGRLFRLFESRFVVHSVEVVGWPRGSTVYTVFEDHVTPPFGAAYVNHGMQIAHVVWGKAVRIRTYVDTARLVAVLDRLAANGVAEAAAPPIEG